MDKKKLREKFVAGGCLRVYADCVIGDWLTSPMPPVQRDTLNTVYRSMHEIGLGLELQFMVMERWKFLNDAPNYNKHSIDTDDTAG